MGKLETVEDLLLQIVTRAQVVGIRFGSPQMVDDVHTQPDMNPANEKRLADG